MPTPQFLYMRKFIFLLIIPCLPILFISLDKMSNPKIEYSRIQDNNIIHSIGVIEGSTPNVELAFESSARIENIFVNEGDSVRQNAVLITQECDQEKHNIDLCNAELDFAISNLRLKKEQYKKMLSIFNRNKQLVDKKSISEQDYDISGIDLNIAKFDLESYEAAVDSAKSRLELAKVAMNKRALVSPIDGIVAKIDIRTGEITGSNTIITLINNSKYLVRGFAEEQNANDIKINQILKVFDGYGKFICDGKIVKIYPNMSKKQAWSDFPDERHDLKTREFIVEIPSESPIIVGMLVDIEIQKY